MAKTLTLTIKNVNLLKEYFQKFNKNKIGSNILTVIYNDNIVTKSCSNDKDYIKISKIPLSDIFEEAQIDIDSPIFIGLFEKQNRIIKYISKFKNGAKFNIIYDAINSKKTVQLVSTSYPEVVGSVLVADRISISDKLLNIKFKTSSIEMISTIFRLTDGIIDMLTSTKKPNILYSKTFIDSETLSSVQGLVSDINNSDNKNAKGFIIKTNSETSNVVLSVDKYFDIKLDGEVNRSVTLMYPTDFSSVLDNEEYNLFSISSNTPNGNLDVLIWKSSESDTTTIVSALKGIEVSVDEDGEYSVDYEDESVDVDTSDFDEDED
jgi:hypothetical protein